MGMKRSNVVAPISTAAGEFEGVSLGDKRLDRRVPAIVERLAADPSASFPELLVTQKEQEAFYRFLRNERVSLPSLLRPHVAATVERARQWGVVVVAHDSTEVSFRNAGRKELYEIRKGSYGFGIHLSLAVGFGPVPCPLGAIAAAVHPDAKSNRGRWLEQALETDSRLEGHSACIHVMDREADVYSLFAGLINADARFVVRARHDRILAPELGQEPSLLDQLQRQAEVLATRDVVISARRATAKTSMPDERKARPPRNSRKARLAIRACQVTLPRPPRQDKSAPRTLQLNIVEARERRPPRNCEPVHWLLATTEPISTPDDLLRVIDLYRTRWVIEEYFKALKTGCAYESRQLEQLDTFTVALGLFIPIAWQLLLLKSATRLPNASARTVLSASHLPLLRALCAHNDHKLPTKPSARDVMMGIARLGGHIRQNGAPGWQVLWRGYKKILDAEMVLEATRNCAKM